MKGREANLHFTLVSLRIIPKNDIQRECFGFCSHESIRFEVNTNLLNESKGKITFSITLHNLPVVIDHSREKKYK